MASDPKRALVAGSSEHPVDAVPRRVMCWVALARSRLSPASRDGYQASASIHHGKRKSSRCSTKSRHRDLFTQRSNKTWEEHGDSIWHERGLGKVMQWRIMKLRG